MEMSCCPMLCAARAIQLWGKWEGRISVMVDSGDCVQPRESRREERRLCAKWCKVCWLLFKMWCAVSTRRMSRMSRTEGRPAPTPSCDMKSRWEDGGARQSEAFLEYCSNVVVNGVKFCVCHGYN